MNFLSTKNVNELNLHISPFWIKTIEIETQIQEPTWCCINWRDHSQVSSNPWFLFHCLFCLRLYFTQNEFYATLEFASVEEEKNGVSHHSAINGENREKKKQPKKTQVINATSITIAINNLGQIIFNALRNVGWIFNQRLNNIRSLATVGSFSCFFLSHHIIRLYTHKPAHRQYLARSESGDLYIFVCKCDAHYYKSVQH